MLDQLRRDLKERLDDVLAEVDKLRRALVALGPDRGATSAPGRVRSTASRRQAASASRRPTSDGRRPSGATKHAVLAALSGTGAMTAGEVAAATGLGRASVSTTLSKLAKSGEVIKAARGYQLAAPAPAETTTAGDQAPEVDQNAARTPATPPRRRPASSQETGAEREPAAERPPRGGRRGGKELSADRVAAMLAERQDGVSAVALAKQLGASDHRVLAVLRELEAAGRARRDGSRRTSRWVVISDEERIAARAAELEARSRQAETVA